MSLLDRVRALAERSPGPQTPPGEGAAMSFLEHLEELRRCVFRAAVGILVAFFVCFYFADRIYGYMERPLREALRAYGHQDKLVYLNPIEPFNLYVKLALIVALFAASPWVLYQVWRFIAPGLYPSERKYVWPFVFCTTLLFVAGGAFAYDFAFPMALHFLIGYGQRFQPFITINEYLDLFSTVVLGVGLIFELPTLIFFLSLLGLVSGPMLVKNFRYAVLIIVVVAAIITPTADVTTMVVFAAPMLVLYVVSIGIAYIFGKDRRRRSRAVSA